MLENPSAQVAVTNRNSSWIVKDKFGGQSYTFRPGERVVVPAEVAEHIFGYGMDEKGRWQKFLRMGIANMKNGKDMWARIDIKPVGHAPGANVKPTGVVREAA